MNPTPRLALLTLTIGLLAACQTTHRAPVEERSYGANPANYRPASPGSVPVVVEESRTEARGNYTVRRGDTLLRIALEHGQNYRDLVAWNNLADANDIRVGQVLRVAPPNTVIERSPGVATPGVTTPGVTTSPITMPPSDTRPATAAVAPKKPAPEKPVPPRTVDALPPLAPAASGALAAPALSDEERVSWMWPSDGKVVGTFEEGKNKGIDISGKLGQRVMAASAGKVMYAGSGIRGYGNLVIVKHSNSVLSAYAHNRAILVKEGDPVVKGQTIAEMGNSDSDSVKLHFEIRQQGKPVDPSRFLPSR